MLKREGDMPVWFMMSRAMARCSSGHGAPGTCALMMIALGGGRRAALARDAAARSAREACWREIMASRSATAATAQRVRNSKVVATSEISSASVRARSLHSRSVAACFHALPWLMRNPCNRLACASACVCALTASALAPASAALARFSASVAAR